VHHSAHASSPVFNSRSRSATGLGTPQPAARFRTVYLQGAHDAETYWLNENARMTKMGPERGVIICNTLRAEATFVDSDLLTKGTSA
jgi:hypothetical protein